MYTCSTFSITNTLQTQACCKINLVTNLVVNPPTDDQATLCKRYIARSADKVTAVFLKLGSVEPHCSAKGRQKLRETKMFTGGRVLFEVKNLRVRV